MEFTLATMYAAVCRGRFSGRRPQGRDPQGRSPRGRAWRGYALVTGFAFGALAGLAPAGSAIAAAPTGVFHGSAYGTAANIRSGPLALSLGPTAFIPCPCLGTNGETISDRLGAVAIGLNGNVLKASGVLSTALTTTTATSKVVEDTARIERLNAFEGLLTADSIVAVANTTATATSVTSTDDGSAFVNLKVAGKLISPKVAPNTTVVLPGIGNVIFKRETRAGGGAKTGVLTVEMIAIHVTTANRFGVPIGAQIVVAHAASGFLAGAPSTVFTGRAWATSGDDLIGDGLIVSLGKTAYQSMSCNGTNGATLTNNVTKAGVDPILALGAGVTSALGSGRLARTTAVLDKVSLLNGLISAKSIRAVAATALANGVRTRSTEGTTFEGLRVLGLPLPINVKPNTKIGLPGVGVVILNEQIVPSATSDAETTVNAIHVFVTTTNLLHLPVGGQLTIGHAAAGVQDAKAGV